MPTEDSRTPEDEALIQKLLAQYESRLRRVLKQNPTTLEQIEDAVDEVGKPANRDLEDELIRKQGTGEQGCKAACGCGQSARYIGDATKRWVTRHGEFHIDRAYYYCRACGKGFCPVDGRLGLTSGDYSPAVVALSARFAGYLPPRAAARELAEVCGITLSATTVRKQAQQIGVALQSVWQREETAFFADPDKEVAVRPSQLHLTGDGVMVHVDGAWHEAKLGCAYRRGALGGVESARYTATLARSTEFGKRFRVLGHVCGADQCRQVGIVADGAEWIWQEVGKYYARRVQILDYYHACQHLWAVAHVVFGEGSEAAQVWMDRQQKCLLSDQVGQVIRSVSQLAPATEMGREVQRRELAYLRTHERRMRYQTFREQGYHIGSGVAEAGCKAVVQARLKGPGMRWTREGAEAMLQLRCAVCSTERTNFRKLARQIAVA
jgi:hypothetical protein